MHNFSTWVEKSLPNVKISCKESKDKSHIMRLFIQHNNVMVKIEPSYVMRGALYPIAYKSLSSSVTDEFGVYLNKIPVVSNADLYAGKICAALNRQHPRDLYDVKILLESDGISSELMDAFVVYLACDQRPMHELLSPNFHDISKVFHKEFHQMTSNTILLDELYAVREGLVNTIKATLSEQHKKFLISVKRGEINYNLLPFSGLEKLPALIWKNHNIHNMDPIKQSKMLEKLEAVLS